MLYLTTTFAPTMLARRTLAAHAACVSVDIETIEQADVREALLDAACATVGTDRVRTLAGCAYALSSPCYAELRDALDAHCAVAKPQMAQLLSGVLDLPLVPNRQGLQLQAGDVVLMPLHMSGRLPEGATELPPDHRLKWLRVSVRACADASTDFMPDLKHSGAW